MSYKAEDFIEAIQGSGGIISTIARKVGCTWRTAQRYIENHPTVKIAYADERESILDLSESVVYRNIALAQEIQKTGLSADTSDAKWVLSRIGKDRGWAERQEITGKDGGPVEHRDVTEYSDEELAAIASRGRERTAAP